MDNNKFRQIANSAVNEAIAENTRLGLPNVFVRNGKIAYQLPNGDIVMEYDWSKHEPYTREEVNKINKQFAKK